jgi:hypothetical protein
MNINNKCLEDISGSCVNGVSLAQTLLNIQTSLNELSVKLEGLSGPSNTTNTDDINSTTKLLSPQKSSLVPDTSINFSIGNSSTGKNTFQYDLSNITRNGTQVNKVQVLGKSNGTVLFNTSADVSGFELPSTSVGTVDINVELATESGIVMLSKSIPVSSSTPGDFKVNMEALDTTSVVSTTLKSQLEAQENELLNLKNQVQTLKNQLSM